jgi:hypothetical protein
MDIKISSNLNMPPSRPTLSGPLSGNIFTEYTYHASSIDPYDEISYFFDWGDGSNSSWLGPYESGDICNATYSWETQAKYVIRCKAKDSNGFESEWSEPLFVTIPKYKINNVYKAILRGFIEQYLFFGCL